MSNETFQGYLKEIEIRYGVEMRVKVERLHQKGHLGEDIFLSLIGQSPAHPIVPSNLGEQIANEQAKSKKI